MHTPGVHDPLQLVTVVLAERFISPIHDLGTCPQRVDSIGCQTP